MYKNVTLLKSHKDGQITWRLLGPNGLNVESFEVFANSLLRKSSYNTQVAYCRHIAEFMDFIYEATFVITSTGYEETITSIVLEEIIESYNEYLVYGGNSGSRVAMLVNASRPSPRNSYGTSAVKHAAVRKFLTQSEQIRRQTLELVKAGLKRDSVDPQPLISGIGERVGISSKQSNEMKANSMIAGVVAGGPKLQNSVVLPTVSSQTKYNHSRAFPYDHIARFIEVLPTFRDKSIYSLLAASGCRSHEGLQILIDDIDVSAGTIKLISPKSRPNHNSYLYLSTTERQRLAWKGRTTEMTFLIEPFASIFFDSFAKYLQDEYIPHGLHQFAFQYIHYRQKGQPFFLSHASSRLETFKRAVLAAGIEDVLSGPHTLRHGYGTYLVNYIPRLDGGYGLPLVVVQQLFGHVSIKQTMKYAKFDEELIQLELRHANAMVFNGADPKSIMQLKLEALHAQLRKVESEIYAQGHKGNRA